MKTCMLVALFFFSCLTHAVASPRYVSLAPSTTEILFALGLDEQVVGVSSFCTYPPQARAKPQIGDFSHPNIEKIFSLKPDHVFGTGLEQNFAIRELTNLGIPVYTADPATIQELFQTIIDIGRITHKTQEAAALINRMKDEIARITARVALIPQARRVKVFLEIWHDPLMTAGKGSYVDELITLAGGINIAHDLKNPYGLFSAERVIALNPGCLIMAYMGKEPALSSVKNRLCWGGIDAVKNKRIFNDIDPNILLRPGPRITDGLKDIYKRLYA